MARDDARAYVRDQGTASQHAAASVAPGGARIAFRRVASLACPGGPLDQEHVALARALLFDAHPEGAHGRGAGRPPALADLAAAAGGGRAAEHVSRKLREMAACGLSADALWELREPDGAAALPGAEGRP